MTAPEFKGFPSISRLSRNVIVTEKLDGTNAQILITEDGGFYTGSRRRWITPEDDNYGFSRWAHGNKDDLMQLGEGQHFGEWWGLGIQRKYNESKKRFSLFNVGRWNEENTPDCVSVVPTLFEGDFTTQNVEHVINHLKINGSKASGGFPDPEGIVIYHPHSKTLFKKTIHDDEKGKSYGDYKKSQIGK